MPADGALGAADGVAAYVAEVLDAADVSERRGGEGHAVRRGTAGVLDVVETCRWEICYGRGLWRLVATYGLTPYFPSRVLYPLSIFCSPATMGVGKILIVMTVRVSRCAFSNLVQSDQNISSSDR